MTREEKYAYNAAWRAANPERMAIYYAKQAVRRALPEVKAAISAYSRSPARKAWKAEWRANNREKSAAYNKAWAAKNAEKLREKRRARYKSDPEYRARHRAANQRPEYKAAACARRRALYATPEGALRWRMSSAIRFSLKSAGKPAKWLDLVGYTVEELRTHLERQFLPKMGWHNMPQWHVDHIVPLSSFQIKEAGDSEFRAAWALTNLRPVWRKENLRKGVRREFLL